MKIGITPWDLSDPRAQALARQGSMAERMGYDSFWLPESHFAEAAVPDPLLLLAVVATVTEHIRLGTTSLLLPLRNPLQAAEQVAVLDQLSGGRVILGVGRGYAAPMLRAFDVDPRAKRAVFEEHLARMQQAWAGTVLDATDAQGAQLALDPLPLQRPHPPIWIAAIGPKALAQAGRLAMPYLASPMETLAQLDLNYQLHRAAAHEAGVPAPDEVPVMRTVFVTQDRAETAALRERVATAARQNARFDQAADIEDWAFIGEPAYVRERAAELRERLGVSHLIVTRLRVGGLPLARLEQAAGQAAEALAGL